LLENFQNFLPDKKLKAIWLSENQNQPLVQFHEEKIKFEESYLDVLLCYMLPQRKKTQETILRRSIIESDEGLHPLRRSVSMRASVTFDTEPQKVRILTKISNFSFNNCLFNELN